MISQKMEYFLSDCCARKSSVGIYRYVAHNVLLCEAAMRPFHLISSALFICSIASTAAWSGGLLGDLVNKVAPGVGTALDDAHRQIKDAIPPYKAIEEGATHLGDEVFVQSNAPILQELIAQSRDDAISSGVVPIPANIRANLHGYIPDNIMNVARYRVGGGGDLSLQSGSIKYNDVAAITLDYVIVFANEGDALYNPTLWVHELKHVEQYQSWGIGDFAKRYIRDSGAVEREAYEAETRYAAWVATSNRAQFASTAGAASNTAVINRPVSPFMGTQASNVCQTPLGPCQTGSAAPVGTPCWCSPPLAIGSLVPTSASPVPVSQGLPSGTGMQVCACWGPNPAQIASEPRCATGAVRVAACGGWCAPGQPIYGYVCQ
jgi:hypothetical protein